MLIILKIVNYSILIIVLLFSVGGFFGKNIHRLELMSHFRWQYLYLGLAILLLSFLLKEKTGLVIALAVIFLNFYEILSLYLPAQKSGEFQTKLKILHINVLVNNRHPEKVMEEIKRYDADFVVLQEINPFWVKNLEVVIQSYPYKKIVLREKFGGLLVLSKYKADFSVIDFKKPAKPKNIDRPGILSRLNITGKNIDILTTHPVTPLEAYRFVARNEQMDYLALLRNTFSENLVVIGDLNMSPFSPHFKDFKKKMQLKDSAQGYGLQNTWRTYKKLLRLSLDHCLISPNMKVVKREIGRDVGSDHLPLYVELGID